MSRQEERERLVHQRAVGNAGHRDQQAGGGVAPPDQRQQYDHRTRERERPDDLDTLASTLYQRKLERETREIARLDQVLTLAAHDGCQTAFLAVSSASAFDFSAVAFFRVTILSRLASASSLLGVSFSCASLVNSATLPCV